MSWEQSDVFFQIVPYYTNSPNISTCFNKKLSKEWRLYESDTWGYFHETHKTEANPIFSFLSFFQWLRLRLCNKNKQFIEENQLSNNPF